jgi:hypothetical protein
VCDPAGTLVPVQLKSRPYVDSSRYSGKGIKMLFPQPKYALGRPWYLVPHDVLYAWVEKHHGGTPKWRGLWHSPSITPVLAAFLKEGGYQLGPSSNFRSGQSRAESPGCSIPHR